MAGKRWAGLRNSHDAPRTLGLRQGRRPKPLGGVALRTPLLTAKGPNLPEVFL